MDQVMEMLKNIPWEDIFNAIKEVVAKIEESGIIDKIVAALTDLFSNISL